MSSAESPKFTSQASSSPSLQKKQQEKKKGKNIDTTLIPIRRATLKDTKALGTILAAGFIDDDVFGTYLYPHRHEYPDDYRLQFTRMMRSHMSKRTHRVSAAIDPHTSRVVGVASWERQGTTTLSSKSLPPDTLPRRIKRFSLRTLNYLSRSFWPDRSIDAQHKSLFDADAANYKHHWSGARKETWYLNFLAVDPGYRGRGVGRALVAEGIRWAEADRVCVSLISSECGDGFYQKMGFVDVGTAMEGALKGLRGGKIKFSEGHLGIWREGGGGGLSE